MVNWDEPLEPEDPISEEEIADYLEMIYDPDFDVDIFEGLR